MLIDCGHNGTTGMRPSLHLPTIYGFDPVKNRLTVQTVTHADEDHLSDFVNTVRTVNPLQIWRNPSVTREVVRQEKQEGGIGPGVGGFLFATEQIYVAPATAINWGGANVQTFWNNYPIVGNTNDLSLVTFIECGTIGILLPGDLERAGWEWLLYKYGESFKDVLRRTNVFVASHHGRENGFFTDIFKFCVPEVIIVSDDKKQFDSQDVDYSRFALGVYFNDGRIRKVLSTRNNGDITLTGPRVGISWIYIAKR